MSRPDLPAASGIFLALTAAAFYGVSGAIAADVFADLSVTRTSEARALIAAAVLVPYAWSRGRLHPRGQVPMLMVLGVNLALVGVTFYWALDRLGVGPGATLQFLGPFVILGWMAVVQGRRVNWITWVAAALAVLGVGLITEVWALSELDELGLASGLTSAVLFASYFLFGEHLGRTLPALTIITWGFVFASVFWIVVQPLWSFPTDLSGKVTAELVWLGIGGTALPFIAQFAALRRLASGLVGVIATAEPVIAAGAAWVLLDQSLSPIQIIGGLMVVLAVGTVHRWGGVVADRPLDVGF